MAVPDESWVNTRILKDFCIDWVRTFNADGGGGGILRDAKTEREWMVIYGGLRGVWGGVFRCL